MMRSLARLAMVAAALSACRPSPVQPPRAPRAAPALAMASKLPADTMAYVVAPSLEDLWNRAEGDSLVAAARADATRLFYRAENRVGVMPRPGALASVGVDVEGPAGLAAILDDDGTPHPVFFLTLAEPARFESALHRFAAREGFGQPGTEGEAVLVMGDELVWLLRDQHAFLMGRGDGSVARRLATFDGAPALAERRAFRQAMAGQITRRTALAGFVDVRGFLFDASGLDPRWAGADLKAARAQLEKSHRATLEAGREAGATMRELAAIDARFRGMRSELRDDETARELRALWGAIEGAGFRLELSERRARLSARIDMPDTAPIARLLHRARPPHTPLKSLEAPPYAAVELTAAPEVLQKHLGALVPFLGWRGDGDGRAKLLAALDGTAAVVVTGDEGGPRLGARLGVRDAGAARTLLEQLGADPNVHPDGDDVIVGVPGVPPVRIGLRGDAVIASSHRALFDRLTTLPATTSYGDRGHVARVLRRSTAPFVMGGHVAALVDGPIPPSVRRLPAPPAAKPTDDERAKVEASLRRIERELQQLKRKRRARLVELRRAWGDALGQLGLTMGWSRGALRLEARWENQDGPLFASLVQLLQGAPTQEDPRFETDDLDALTAQLNLQRFDLLGELQKLESPPSPPQQPEAEQGE